MKYRGHRRAPYSDHHLDHAGERRHFVDYSRDPRTDDDDAERHFDDDRYGRSERRMGHEGWRRGRVSGGFGSHYAAWSSGLGATPAGFGFGPPEDPFLRFSEAEEWSPSRMETPQFRSPEWRKESYRGRGPKGYRRSDERIREDVCEQLTDDWSVDAHDITIEVENGEVTLTGTVPSREQKRCATECVETITGVSNVFNQLRVARADEGREHSR